MFKSPCTTRVVFEKNQYCLGEEASVTISCDNSECSKDITNFKFELFRRYVAHSGTAMTRDYCAVA